MAAMGLCVAFNFVLCFIIPLVAHLNYIYYAGKGIGIQPATHWVCPFALSASPCGKITGN